MTVSPVAVAVGVLVDKGCVLLSQRLQHTHQGGLWEFPGGKIEPGEPVFAALQREFREELGLNVESAEPLLDVTHRYSDKAVCLKVWQIQRFQGEPQGLEGQLVRWVPLSELSSLAFPEANRPILETLLGLDLDDAAYKLK